MRIGRFAGKLFGGGDTIKNDYLLRQLRVRAAPPTQISPYEFIILDEVQDMTGILYWLTCTLMSSLSSLPKPPKLLLLGDPRQAIYGYQGADARYLELGKELLSDYTPYPWQKLELAKSHRLSPQNASFVNASLEENYIEGSGSGPVPIYVRCETWNSSSRLAKKIH
jgi:superfamily I DNA/RNA helicase